ncbi:MAG: hypothetical protein LBM41_02515 [Ruminococcus sp.]|jgi:hypothetical protein|nr:hypothetical protein [Ruminococcus sp.]
MKKIKELFEPAIMPIDVYFQSLFVQFGLFVLLILAIAFSLLLGAWDWIFVAFGATGIISIAEILFSIIYPLLKRHDIKFRNRLIIIALSPGLFIQLIYWSYVFIQENIT